MLRVVSVVVALMLLGSGCSLLDDGGVESVSSPVADPDNDDAADPEGDDPTKGNKESPIASFQDAQDAIIQVLATGSFVDAQDGELSGSWSGSGFFIESNGLAVTNNHVVTGAAIVEVLVAGEDEPRSAKVIGVDECSDLAVIDVEGDNYPALDWYEDGFDVGTRVYAAGFPLGDPEYTLTEGIISKREANGSTSWTDVEAVIEHSARINRGNSGGPLITEDGRVIGVNFGANQTTDQNFAITAGPALPIIDKLSAGTNGDGIGIAGRALVLDDGLSGIWVESVDTGQPAYEAGVSAGDFIYAIENIPTSADGTLSDYCRIMSTRGTDAPMKLEVFRPATGEFLAGTINSSDDQLQVVDVAISGGAGNDDTAGGVVVNTDYGQLRIPDTMAGWEITQITIGNEPFMVAVADTEAKRATGTLRASSLYDLDAVLFAHSPGIDVSYWTRGALFNIDLIFFGSDQRLDVSYLDLSPCTSEPANCARFPGTGISYAASAPAGTFSQLQLGAELAVDGR